MWYYYEKRLRAGEEPLYGRYDDNDYLLSTLDFGEDDSWSYRFASVVQDTLIDWDHSSRAFFKAMGRTSDQLTWASFAYAMLQTGEPLPHTIPGGTPAGMRRLGVERCLRTEDTGAGLSPAGRLGAA